MCSKIIGDQINKVLKDSFVCEGPVKWRWDLNDKTMQ